MSNLSRLILGVLVSWWLIPTWPHAQQPLLTNFYFRATSNAVHTRDLFQWPVATDIDAVLKLDVPSAANAVVLILISSGGEVVGKYKGKHALAAGAQELRLPKVFSTERILGQRLLTAQLELAVKGYAVERREITFEVKGPPQPKVEISGLRVYSPTAADNPSTASTVTQFGVGQPFMIEVIFNVIENPARLKPRLIVLASMEEDDTFTGYGLQAQTYEDHYDMKTIELEDGAGPRRVVLRGSTPRMFADPWSNHHPFKVYAAIDFGSGQRVVKHIEADVFDYTPGETRRNDDPAYRLVSIARQQSWAVSLPGLPDNGTRAAGAQ